MNINTNNKDDELIFFLTLHSDQATRLMKRRFSSHSKYLVNDTSRNYSVPPSKEQLLNLCLCSLEQTIERSDVRIKGFYSYWRKSSVNHLRETIFKENKYLSSKVSMDKEISLKHGKVSLHEVIPENVEKPTITFTYEDVIELLKDKGFDMDIEEKDIFKYYLLGHSIRETTEHFKNYSFSKIYRMIQKAKDKVRNALSYRGTK